MLDLAIHFPSSWNELYAMDDAGVVIHLDCPKSIHFRFRIDRELQLLDNQRMG